MNRKRVQRLWQQAGLRVATKQTKPRRLGSDENGCAMRHSEYPNHVWSYDFLMDQTEDGRRLKLMPVVDEYTREWLALEVDRSITSKEVVGVIWRLMEERGEPGYIRSDNGPEFIAGAIKSWLTPRARRQSTSSQASVGERVGSILHFFCTFSYSDSLRPRRS